LRPLDAIIISAVFAHIACAGRSTRTETSLTLLSETPQDDPGNLPKVIGPTREPKLQWHFQTQGRVLGLAFEPGEQLLYATSEDGTLYALDTRGKLRFHRRILGSFTAGPILSSNGTLFLTLTNGTVFALDSKNRVLWTKLIAESIFSAPVLGPNLLYVAAKGVYTLNTQRGTARWYFAASDWLTAAPTVHLNGDVAWAAQGHLRALKRDGSLHWTTPLADAIDASLLVTQTRSWIAATLDGNVLCINEQGRVLFRFGSGSPIVAAPVNGTEGTILIATVDGTLYALSQEGAVLWHAHVEDGIVARPRIDSAGHIFIGTQYGWLLGLTARGQLLWKYNVGAPLRSPSVLTTQGALAIGADDGKVYLFQGG